MRAGGTSTARIEAYRVVTGYDEGGGQSLEVLLDEIEEDLLEGDPRWTTQKSTAAELRRCKGSTRFGIEPHEAPVSDFPRQPSREDGLGTMCTARWRAYVKGLREARRAAKLSDEATVAGGEEADAA